MQEVNYILVLASENPVIAMLVGAVLTLVAVKGRLALNFVLALVAKRPSLPAEGEHKKPANGLANPHANKQRIETLEDRITRYEETNHAEHREMMLGLGDVKSRLAEARADLAEVRTDVHWIKKHLQNGSQR